MGPPGLGHGPPALSWACPQPLSHLVNTDLLCVPMKGIRAR